jgi:hypothetical protein
MMANTSVAWRKENPLRWAEIQRRFREKNRERLNAKRRARSATPEGRLKTREYMRTYRARKYGTSAEAIKETLANQGHRCAICETQLEIAQINTKSSVRGNTAVTDHAITADGPRMRGILCSRCNVGLGMFSDDPKRLRAASDYCDKKR